MARFGFWVSVVAAALMVAGCGGGSPSSPSDPSMPGTVTVVVFYDENANGTLDAMEVVRVPGVVVSVAGRTGTSAVLSGRAVITGVPGGTHTLSVDPSTLPPFYVRVSVSVTVTMPQTTGEVHVPLTLPIGGNRPNTYMAFGNSITDGRGMTDGLAYRGVLQSRLEGHFGRAEVINQGIGSTSSLDGAERIAAVLQQVRPAYTLVHYGTNDYHKAGCRRIDSLDTCFTLPSLRTIVQETKAAGSLPVLATIIPSNTGYSILAPPQRNRWVSIQDEKIRALAQEEGALLVDLEAAFLQAAPLDTLFLDHIHPNEAGYQLMGETFFLALAFGRLS